MHEVWGRIWVHAPLFDDVRPGEVIHIGDSVTSDVESALKLGITPIYLSRRGKTELDGVRVITSLD